MIAYVDASVVLRLALREPSALAEWNEITIGVTSALTRVECFRSVSRYTLSGRLSDDEQLRLAIDLDATLWRFRTVPLAPSILEHAASHMPMPLTALDALHLATAMRYRSRNEQPLTFATHDRALAAAARAHGFPVLGA